ncbi:MAG: hypothetical protein CFE38_19900 [Comamonadaceae bacterium PBBC1]|nr:MAG: hypothetical protein CFE38_19900 [Comamonadaceae bacterium PBBC1]
MIQCGRYPSLTGRPGPSNVTRKPANITGPDQQHDEGFGEGNFKALFESLERDQIRRGAIVVDAL